MIQDYFMESQFYVLNGKNKTVHLLSFSFTTLSITNTTSMFLVKKTVH